MTTKKKTIAVYKEAFLQNKDMFYNTVWITKFYCKFMFQGKKHLVENHVRKGFIALKFVTKKLPGFLVLKAQNKFRPIISFVKKRMGRKFNSVPIPITKRRQFILALSSVASYIKNFQARNFSIKIKEGVKELHLTKRNVLTKKIGDLVKHLVESRIYLHLRWK